MAGPRTFNPSPLHRPDLSGDFEGNDYELQPSSLPRSRAPSYVSKSSSWNSEGRADEALLPGRGNDSPQGTKNTWATTQAATETSAGTSNREKRRKLQGWRFGVAVSALTAFTVLLLNMILTIYAGVKFGTSGGIGTAFDGSCERVDIWTTWLHILINGLSSILLSASNYTMQCLSSPTRSEIDRAHTRGDWLDVGVISMRNLWRIDWRRTVLWWLLGLSSVPIHLLYNSAIFKTLVANEYVLVVASKDFLQGGDFAPFYSSPKLEDFYLTYRWTDFATVENILRWAESGYEDFTVELDEDRYQAIRGVQLEFSENDRYADEAKIHNLTTSECMTAYGTSFLSEYRNVVAITSARGNQTNNTMLWSETVRLNSQHVSYGQVLYEWICRDAQDAWKQYVWKCNVGAASQNASNWTIHYHQIDYCLAQATQPRCKLQFSIQILATVIVMNVCKFICMFLTLWRQRTATLVTIGDAMSSFLDRPDSLTKNRCLMGRIDLNRGPLLWKTFSKDGTTTRRPNTIPERVTFRAPLRRRWFAAASIRRWCLTIGICLIALSVASKLLHTGALNLENKASASIFETGFGAVDSRALITTKLLQDDFAGLGSAVLLANMPQAVMSFLYLTYNGLFTCMCLAHEYSQYGLIKDRKKPLRVTTQHGQQRPTYYLQLPFRYAVPLLVSSATLHWLISQSIFLVKINTTDYKGESSAKDFSQVGYSCLPILLAILLGTAMLIAALGCGFRRFPSYIPVAGSCSVALAAAAHRPKDDVDAAFLPVQWGEVRGEGTDEVGHCCFTSQEVHDLFPGRLYAGAARKPYDNGSKDP
ncbi:hypothetical protein D0865_13702 [Hortaea werneckii]|uniref:DUF6536 domain-containing protein n=1 Tax=Hortaea werneckii TaxID=91943 RepID=A0A3M7B972_HORWE|nr:hypothetical protein D0865_13702 [Hortaea werneckii]